MQQLKNITLIILSTILGWIGSYLYHPVMNHYLAVADFARFESLASMFIILSTITAGFSLYLTRAFSHKKDIDAWLYRWSQRFFIIIGLLIYLCYLPFIWWIDSLLSIGSPALVAIIGWVIPISFASLTQWSWLQWRGEFGFFSLYATVVPFWKLFFGWVFVFMGFGVFGAIGGFLTSSLLVTVVLFFWIQRMIRWNDVDSLSEIFSYFWKARIELLHFFLLAFLLALLQNMDLILVNRFFPGDIAGKYALVSVIMKFVIFLAASVEIVYYPKLAHQDFQKKDLFHAIGLLILGSVIGYILLRIMGLYVLTRVNIVFQEFDYLIPYFYIFSILFAWVSFFMKIAIAHRFYSVNIIAILVSLGLFWFIEMQSAIPLLSYISAFIVALTIVLFFSMSIFFYQIFSQKMRS